MRASTSSATTDTPLSADLTGERALRAAALLREALALLGTDRTPVQLLNTTRASDRLLRLPEVQRLTGLRRSAIYEQMQRGNFPRSVKAGSRAATWSEAAIQAWISDRIDAVSAKFAVSTK
jgi:prophage regulatory protein